MVSISTGKFRVSLLTPGHKLLDCRCGSLILPGHDGQIGILRNHAPMMCKLGLGIMHVKEIPNDRDKFYILEGGFVRVVENNVVVLAYEVTTFEGLDADETREMLGRAQQVLVGGSYVTTHVGEVDFRRSQLVVRMAQLSNVEAGSEA